MDAAVEFEKLYEIVEPLVTRAVTCWKQWSPPEMLPAVGFDLTREETAALARAIVLSLPEHCRERLPRHGGGRKTEIMK